LLDPFLPSDHLEAELPFKVAGDGAKLLRDPPVNGRVHPLRVQIFVVPERLVLLGSLKAAEVLRLVEVPSEGCQLLGASPLTPTVVILDHLPAKQPKMPIFNGLLFSTADTPLVGVVLFTNGHAVPHLDVEVPAFDLLSIDPRLLTDQRVLPRLIERTFILLQCLPERCAFHDLFVLCDFPVEEQVEHLIIIRFVLEMIQKLCIGLDGIQL